MINPMKLAILAVVGLVAMSIVGVGLVVADDGDGGTRDGTGGEPAARADAYLDNVAERLGVTREELDEAMQGARLDAFEQAVADGLIDEEHAAKFREFLESGEGGFGVRPFFGGHRFGRGFGGDGFHGGGNGGHHDGDGGTDSTDSATVY